LPYFKKLENVKSPLLASDSKIIWLDRNSWRQKSNWLVHQIMASIVHFLLKKNWIGTIEAS
jgi:hypothetical protein